MNMHPHRDSPADTRQRLIEAAGEVFAERGFRAATIRDIVERAGANIAAVNYHFGDKENLYVEALSASCHQKEALPCSPDDGRTPGDGRIPDGGGTPGAQETSSHNEAGVAMAASSDEAGAFARTPAGRLHAFVRQFLARSLAPSGNSWHDRLVAREILEPTPALQILVDRFIRPSAENLVALVKELSGRRLQDPEAWMCANSIIAQCVHQKHGEPITRRLNPEIPQGPEHIDILAEHITRFSLAAMSAYCDLPTPATPNQPAHKHEPLHAPQSPMEEKPQ